MLMNEAVMSDYAYLQLQIWNGLLEQARNYEGEVGPRAGCTGALGGGGHPTMPPPCPAEGVAGRWLGVPEGWVQAVPRVWAACMCAYARVLVCCVCDSVCGLCVCADVHVCVSGPRALLCTHVFCCQRERCTQTLQSPAKSRGILYFHGLPW